MASSSVAISYIGSLSVQRGATKNNCVASVLIRELAECGQPVRACGQVLLSACASWLSGTKSASIDVRLLPLVGRPILHEENPCLPHLSYDLLQQYPYTACG